LGSVTAERAWSNWSWVAMGFVRFPVRHAV
jgi:hypothetical protein